jgi:hypothetical protein
MPKLRGLRDQIHLHRCLIINPYDLGICRGRHSGVRKRHAGLVAGWAVYGTINRQAAIAPAVAMTTHATHAMIVLAILDLLLLFVVLT